MECDLCGNTIEPYTPAFNRLVINNDRSFDICQSCITKFVTWQGKQLATLFPTKLMKKRFAKKG